MIIKRAKRGGTSYCRVCGYHFKRNEAFFKLDGSYRVMRGNICMIHMNLASCDGCADRLKCLTQNTMTRCIVGPKGNVKAQEY